MSEKRNFNKPSLQVNYSLVIIQLFIINELSNSKFNDQIKNLIKVNQGRKGI